MHRRCARLLPAAGLLGALALSVITADGQLSARPAGTVSGHVTCDDGGVPARSASVNLRPLASLLPKDNPDHADVEGPPESKTDFAGYYDFPDVAPGTYLVDAGMDGYSADLDLLLSVLDRFTPDQQKKLLAAFPQLTVTAGSSMVQDVVIHRGGAVSGHITVDSGGTIGRSRVTATMVSSKLLEDSDSSSDGQKRVQFSSYASTDDHGAYRIAGLPAGQYRISVRLTEAYFGNPSITEGNSIPNPTRPGTAELTVSAPEALADTDAHLESIGDGDELSGVNLNIPTRLLHSIGGVITQGGTPFAGAILVLQLEGKKPSPFNAVSTADGSYRFDLLPSGFYTVTARNPKPSDSKGTIATQKTQVQLGDTDVTSANIEWSGPARPKQ